MPKGGGSNSESTNTTQTTTEDNKVSATDNAIALGNSATLNYTENLPDNAVQVFNELVGLAKDAGLVAIGFAKEAISANQKSVDAVQNTSKNAIDAANLKDAALLKSSIPYIAAIAIAFFIFSGKGKR